MRIRKSKRAKKQQRIFRIEARINKLKRKVYKMKGDFHMSLLP